MNEEKWNKLLWEFQAEYTPSRHSHLTRKVLDDLKPLIPQGTKSILEIGMGDGFFLSELRNMFPEAKLRGMSLSKTEIENAKVFFKFKDEEIKMGDMHEIPFSDGEFDLIFMRDVFEHSIAPYIALCEIARTLKVGGTAIVVMPSYEWRNYPAHYFIPDPEQMAILVNKARLNLIDIHYKVWMFYGMTFGMREWVYIIKKEEKDNWFYETKAEYDKACAEAIADGNRIDQNAKNI